MNKLIAELRRLYFLQNQDWQRRNLEGGGRFVSCAASVITDESLVESLRGEAGVVLDLVDRDGMVRTMVVDFGRAADWDQAARLFQGVLEDLELPAPAISVSGQAGYRLWFSLAECVPVAQAQAFLNGLQRKYLSEIPLVHVKCRPIVGESASADDRLLSLTPAPHRATGKWSAFIDPGLGSMFIESPGLETTPNMDRQADILSRLDSIKAEDFERALNAIQTPPEMTTRYLERSAGSEGHGQADPEFRRAPPKLNVGNNFSDPKSFLLAVMNDLSATTGQRIKAATALLPFFDNSGA